MNFLTEHPAVELSGAWQMAFTLDAPPAAARLDDLTKAALPLYPATVPGNFELDLHANGLGPEPFFGMNVLEYVKYERAHLWYGRSFRADLPPADQEAFLEFEGLDCYADIHLNGQLIGSTDNALIAHRFNVTGLLRADNELLVHIRPAAIEAEKFNYPADVAALAGNYESLYVRKPAHAYGWDIMCRAVSGGLWRPVRLRLRPRRRIEQVYLHTQRISPARDRCRMRLDFRCAIEADATRPYQIEITGSCGASSFTQTVLAIAPAGQAVIDLENPRLWWPAGYGPADLYDVRVRMLRDGQLLDSVRFRHGIRTTELLRTDLTDRDGNGEFCFRVNGERIFAKGTNHVPVDAYHSRDAARIDRILDMARRAHCNIIRCWGGNVYECDRFFDLCDEHGIMVWQDFAMGCAIYPQDAAFQKRLADEATVVIRRLRQHASLVLWSGDNECDFFWLEWGRGDPNRNVLTRQVLPDALRADDPGRPYLPSSPYVAPSAAGKSADVLPENHLWGPRNYFKSDFYVSAPCHFASEIGYHGCPSPQSVAKFISPERLWPWRDNPEWSLHATDPLPQRPQYVTRSALMDKQVRAYFGDAPDTLEGFAFASQATQAEAKKFFIERFRGGKWRRTGIIWWNLIDGWPQMSDAVVDYYFEPKLAYETIARSQQHLCLMLSEPQDGVHQILALNDTLRDMTLDYTVTDIDTGEVVAQGKGDAPANRTTPLGTISSDGRQRFFVLEWTGPLGAGRNHYVAGVPPFDVRQYRQWLAKANMLPAQWKA